MDTRQLNYFITAAEALNFTAAAKKHFVAQSAISQQIRELEKTLGVQLFVRNNRSVKLTPAGEVFLAEARLVVARCDEAVRKTRLAAAGVAGSLKIGFILPMEKKILPGIIRDFFRACPGVNLTLIRLDWGAMLESLVHDDVELAFTFDLGLDDIPGIRKAPIRPDSPAVAVPLDHPLADKSRVIIADLAEEPIVIFPRETNPPWYDLTLKIFAQSGVSPHIAVEHPRLETRLMMVEAGMGVAVVTHLSEACASANLRFLDLEDTGVNLNLVAAWKDTNPNPSVALFGEFVARQGEEKI